jgi:ABC-type spermidine/putrescine transport system permease subunit I
MSDHPGAAPWDEDETVSPVPEWVISLMMGIDRLMGWIFRFSKVGTWSFIALVFATFLASNLFFSEPEREAFDVGWSAYYDSYGELTKPLDEIEGPRIGMLNGDIYSRSLRLHEAFIIALLMLPFWVAYRLALLPFYLAGRRLMRRFRA